MRALRRPLSVLAASLVLVACSASENKSSNGTAGRGGAGTAGMGTAGSVTSGTAGTPGTAGAAVGTGGDGSGTAGAQGAAGATGGASGGSGAAGSTTGTAGSGGGAGSSNSDGGTQVADGAVLTTAGCANHNYQLCMDFESPVDTTVWSGGNAAAIETTHVAHGTHAYHLYSMAGMPAGGVFSTSKLGTLKDQIWGRFYVHFSPGAPGNHGNLVAASDGVFANGNYNGNWYEIGWQFDGIMGVFHSTSGERPLRSMPYIKDQWYCVELFFDGTVKGSPRWWIDGAEAQYYTPQAGVCCAASNPTTPPSVLIPQFKSITVGWTPYQGLQLMLPDQKAGPNEIVDSRSVTDAWMDDVAFDTQRIGCIQ